ncbi:cytochrome c3 family protein [Campylobacter geochelonis]|uniref:cytochrome c3 family protein n=1 Tax=Campylobacter geochelonis TaxID=1780362 RepID=UPI00077099A1|nr:cytochrome c3 family protein [Campylobacter geochelonis]CZE47454.1 fumarate reductase flavoprotein subunit [Campylobacter geochelonis]
MKKLILMMIFACSVAFGFDSNSSIMEVLRNSKGEVVTDFSSKAFPIKGIHKKLDLKCTDCHLEKDEKDYSSAMQTSCLQCHESYPKLREYTGGLGHDHNIHEGPHYEALDCDNCHKTHDEKPVNMCAKCHNQESMLKLIVK